MSFNDLPPAVHLPTRIFHCDAHSPSFLDLVPASDSTPCSLRAFQLFMSLLIIYVLCKLYHKKRVFHLLKISDHSVISADQPISLKKDVRFHRTALVLLMSIRMFSLIISEVLHRRKSLMWVLLQLALNFISGFMDLDQN